jgi:alpha-glucosidase
MVSLLLKLLNSFVYKLSILKISKCVFLIFSFVFLCLSPTVNAQSGSSIKECIGYSIKGNEVIFKTKDGSALSLKLCSPSMVKIWFDPKSVFKTNNPSFAVINENIEVPEKIDVNEESSCYEIFTSKLRIRLNKNPMQLQIFDKWQKLLFSDYAGEGYISEGKSKTTHKTLRPDEQFYGLGEKTGSLDRRGKVYKMWNSDRPCYSLTEDPLYKSIPFFMSNYRYGIFLDNTYKSVFNFGAESNSFYSFEVPDGAFIYYFMAGKDYADILSQYIDLTGKPIMPPKWAMGFAQCRGLYTKQAQAEEIARTFREKKIPCDIIYQDIGWTQYLQDFNWRKENYSDPKAMLVNIKKQGFKMIVSQDPVISQANKPQWEAADRLGYLALDVRTNKSYDMPWPWGGNCGVVDFTNPAVADWWGAQQQQPIDDGVSGFWTDMGEPAWSNEEDIDRLHMKHFAGMHDEIHNVYGLTWDKVVKEQFDKRNPNKRVFQMTRSAYAGLQRYTFGWSGDSGSGQDVLEGWDVMQNQLAMAISAGIGGIPFWTTDISGYCGDIKDYPAMAELYTRWMQFGVFNPLSRAHHEGDNAAEPWMFGEVAEKNARSAIELKYKLFPYIYTYSRIAHDTGLPIIRGLFFEFPSNQEVSKIEDQFMFGKEILVAPVFKKGERVRQVVLPNGEWIDFNDKKTVYLGGQKIAYRAPLNVIPIFVRKGSIIPQMPVMLYIHENKDFPLLVDIFPNYDGESAVFELYEDDGESQDYLKNIYSKTKFECVTSGNELLTTISPVDKGFIQSDKRNIVLKYYLESVPVEIMVDGKKASKTKLAAITEKVNFKASKVEWSWNEESRECTIILPDNRKEIKIKVSLAK